MKLRWLLPGCLGLIWAAGVSAPGPVQAQQTRPQPAPPPVSPGTESTARQRLTPPPPGAAAAAESSARELQPGAGEAYIPPPPIPPVPPSMHALQAAENEARANGALTLEQVEQMALRLNPTLKQARAEVESSFGTAIQAGLWPNPTIAYMGMALGLAGTPGMFQGGMLSQPIITAGKRRLDRARFLEMTRAAQWEAMAVEYRVLNDVRVHYFHTLGLQAIVEIEKELVENMEDEVVTVRESYNLGIHNRRELHEVNAALQQERLTYLRVQNDLRESWQTLMAIVGTQMPFTRLAGGLEGDTTPLEYDPALQRILEFSPDVQKTYANLRYEQTTLKWERVQPWPNIVAVGGPGYHFATQRAVATSQIHLQGVPVWNWNQGNIRAANAQVLRQQAEIRRVSLKLQNDLSVVYRTYITGLQHVESFQRVILPELRRAYELTLDSYESDRNTWGDVLLTQRQYYMARMTYVTRLMMWRESEVLIVGFLLHGGLKPAPMPSPPTAAPGAINPSSNSSTESMTTPSSISPPG